MDRIIQDDFNPRITSNSYNDNKMRHTNHLSEELEKFLKTDSYIELYRRRNSFISLTQLPDDYDAREEFNVA